MGFFDDLSKKVSDAGQKTIQKTKELSDIARLNSMISEEETKVNNNYYRIGKLYVSMHASDCENEFAGIITSIRDSESRIAEYKKEIQDIKGVQHCEKCGAEIAKGVAFCSVCGNPMPKMNNVDTSKYERCSACGALVEKGMRFCTSCGTPMSGASVLASSKASVNESLSNESLSNMGSVNENSSNVGSENVTLTNVGSEGMNFASVFNRQEEAIDEEPAEKVCPKCGAKLDADSVFCMECGTKIGD